MSQPSGEEIAAVYAGCSARIAEFAGTLDDDQLGRRVAGTPDWTVIELLSHLVGGPVDVVAGNLEGVATPPWTKAQVEARRGRSVDELMAEWAGVRDPVLDVCRSGVANALSFDIATHEQDLRAALGLVPLPDDQALDLVASGMAGRAVREASKAGLAPLQIGDGDGWSVGDPGGVSVTAPKLELFRVVTGRRSARQVSALDWQGDAAPYLAMLSPFGPLGDTDVIE